MRFRQGVRETAPFLRVGQKRRLCVGEGGVFDAAIRVLAVVQDRKSYIDKFFVLTVVSKNGIITSHKIKLCRIIYAATQNYVSF